MFSGSVGVLVVDLFAKPHHLVRACLTLLSYAARPSAPTSYLAMMSAA